MILVRIIFQARWGKGNELAAAIKQAAQDMSAGMPSKLRVLTDLSGEFDTVVLEGEHESLAAWEQFRTPMFANPQFHEGNARSVELISAGRQEYYTIEPDS